jgi:hypothetical protein
VAARAWRGGKEEAAARAVRTLFTTRKLSAESSTEPKAECCFLLPPLHAAGEAVCSHAPTPPPLCCLLFENEKQGDWEEDEDRESEGEDEEDEDELLTRSNDVEPSPPILASKGLAVT